MTNQEYAEGLRELARIYDENPLMPQPSGDFYIFCHGARELFTHAIRAFGAGDKRQSLSGEELIFKPTDIILPVQIWVHKEVVCTRRVVGERTVPELIIPASPERVVPEHKEEIVEWDCGPFLGGE